MEKLYEVSRIAAEKIRQTKGTIYIVSDYDCDGLTSASILIKALSRAGKNFRLMVSKSRNLDLIGKIKEHNPKLVVFADLGTGYMEQVSKLECDVIVIDHHEVKSDPLRGNIIHVNPKIFGIRSLSSSCVSYLVAKALSEENKDLVSIAIVGAVADMEDENSVSLKEIFKDAGDFVQIERGLSFFGRMTRPIHKALELSHETYIPGVSGNESSALQFLSELGIELKTNGKWKTLSDLSNDELKRLTDAIIRERMRSKGSTNVFSNVYTLKKFVGELQDAREFGTILNACGRLGKISIAIQLCQGEESALASARSILARYKKLIASSIDWMYENSSKHVVTGKAVYIIAGGHVKDTILGTVINICARSFLDKSKIMVGFADGGDGVKVSARMPVNGGNVDIDKLMVKAAADCGGTGGGHKEAGGAYISKGKEQDFIKSCESFLNSN